MNIFERLRRSGENTNGNEAGSVQDKVRREMVMSGNLKNGANWFYWIAGLSMINSVVTIFNGSINFVIGLGITQIVDGLAYNIFDNLGLIAIIGGAVIDIIISGIFVFFGVMANRAKRWSFIIGMVLYGLDTLVFIFYKDFIGIGFHLLALYGIFKGFKVINYTDEMNMESDIN